MGWVDKKISFRTKNFSTNAPIMQKTLIPPLQDEACLARWLKTITAFSSLAAQLLSSELSFVLSDWGDCPLMQLHLPAQLTQVCDNALQLLAQQLLLHQLYCNFAFWNHSVTYIVQSNLMFVCLDVFIKMVGSGYPIFSPTSRCWHW